MDVYLEDLINEDMINHGYDFNNPLDVEAYWEQRL